mgnify:CR=1 FL=1
MTTMDHRDEGVDVQFSYEEHLVTAIDVETGVAASGDSKADALAELADALALHEGGGEEIEDENVFLREIGFDTQKLPDPGQVIKEIGVLTTDMDGNDVTLMFAGLIDKAFMPFQVDDLPFDFPGT